MLLLQDIRGSSEWSRTILIWSLCMNLGRNCNEHSICNIVKIHQGFILCPLGQPMACLSVSPNPYPGTWCQIYCQVLCSQKTHFKISQLQYTANKTPLMNPAKLWITQCTWVKTWVWEPRTFNVKYWRPWSWGGVGVVPVVSSPALHFFTYWLRLRYFYLYRVFWGLSAEGNVEIQQADFLVFSMNKYVNVI